MIRHFHLVSACHSFWLLRADRCTRPPDPCSLFEAAESDRGQRRCSDHERTAQKSGKTASKAISKAKANQALIRPHNKLRSILGFTGTRGFTGWRHNLWACGALRCRVSETRARSRLERRRLSCPSCLRSSRLSGRRRGRRLWPNSNSTHPLQQRGTPMQKKKKEVKKNAKKARRQTNRPLTEAVFEQSGFPVHALKGHNVGEGHQEL